MRIAKRSSLRDQDISIILHLTRFLDWQKFYSIIDFGFGSQLGTKYLIPGTASLVVIHPALAFNDSSDDVGFFASAVD